jgi:hypothetical protein
MGSSETDRTARLCSLRGGAYLADVRTDGQALVNETLGSAYDSKAALW